MQKRVVELEYYHLQPQIMTLGKWAQIHVKRLGEKLTGFDNA